MPLRALFTRRIPVPQTIEVAFDRAVYTVAVRRNRQARRYTLRIDAPTRQVMLTMPLRGSMREATSFAQQHGGWIAARLTRLPAGAPFVDGSLVPLRGEPHRVVHRPGARGTVWVEPGEGEPRLCVAGEAPHLARRLTDYLKRCARQELEQASRRHADAIGVGIKSVSVRDQISRWGSCSSTGRLSFSWRLILAPPNILDYLAAHEVAHLVEMNHSRRFWRIVRRICPDMDRARIWLDARGADLYRYGARRD